jgi:hypothetical protein
MEPSVGIENLSRAKIKMPPAYGIHHVGNILGLPEAFDRG